MPELGLELVRDVDRERFRSRLPRWDPRLWGDAQFSKNTRPGNRLLKLGLAWGRERVKARKLQQENVTPRSEEAPVSRFTGKEEDIEIGLQYFGKRFLSPYLGRWVSADPLAVHSPGRADLNLYAYVHGAVLKAIDPLGLEDTCSDGTGPSPVMKWMVSGMQAAARSGAAGITGTLAYAYSRVRGQSDAEARLHAAKVMTHTAGITDLYPLPVVKGAASQNLRAVSNSTGRPIPTVTLGAELRDTGVAVKDPVSGKAVAQDFKLGKDGIASGLVDVEGTAVRGRDAFNAALGELGKGGARIKGFHAEWIDAPGVADNLKTFNDAIRGGAKLDDAARSTFTGKVLGQDHGMTEARVDLATSTRNADGTFKAVDVYFSAPKTPAKPAQ